MPAKMAIFTHREAKQKICPVSMNTEGGEFCIGRICMAWRWVETHIHSDPGNPSSDLVPNGETYGYCGMAGDPRASMVSR